MSTNNGNVEVGRVLLAGDLSNESLSTDNVKSGDTEQALGVVDTLRLEDLGCDGNGRVDLYLSMNCSNPSSIIVDIQGSR